MKRIKRSSSEYTITKFFASSALLSDPRNHSVLALDCFEYDTKISHSWSYLYCVASTDRAFSFIRHVVHLILQTLEVNYPLPSSPMKFSRLLLHPRPSFSLTWKEWLIGEEFLWNSLLLGTFNYWFYLRIFSNPNIVLDGTSLYPMDFHPTARLMTPSGLLVSRPLRRADVPSVKYNITDFGISSHFPGPSTPCLLTGLDAQDKFIQSFQAMCRTILSPSTSLWSEMCTKETSWT